MIAPTVTCDRQKLVEISQFSKFIAGEIQTDHQRAPPLIPERFFTTNPVTSQATSTATTGAAHPTPTRSPTTAGRQPPVAVTMVPYVSFNIFNTTI